MPSTPSLYNVIEERRLSEERLPTFDDLQQAVNALDGVQEFLTGAIAMACITVGNASERDSVSYEQIGQLTSWSNHIRGILESIERDVEKVTIVAVHTFPVLAEGYEGDGTPYGELGLYDESHSDRWFQQIRRRLGFASG